MVGTSAVTHNGPALNGRPGTEPRWNHKDRSARPVRCSAWLFGSRFGRKTFCGRPVLIGLKPCFLYNGHQLLKLVRRVPGVSEKPGPAHGKIIPNNQRREKQFSTPS